MRGRFLAEEIWERMGMDVDGCIQYARSSALMQQYTKLLFSRIVPTIKAIGLWGERIQGAFTDMNVIEFAQIDVETLSRADEDVASEFDRLRAKRDGHVASVIAGAESGD